MNFPTSQQLTNLARIYGIKRRWFGLESDKSLCKRMIAYLSNR